MHFSKVHLNTAATTLLDLTPKEAKVKKYAQSKGCESIDRLSAEELIEVVKKVKLQTNETDYGSSEARNEAGAQLSEPKDIDISMIPDP
jgi:hypothetical protein